ncbi:MAG: hypothetical protein S4CHLAM123_08460 [Chlamydiales bacterium]|nr:hypothetical protein [Chlamydiales bacterium]
MEKSFVSRTTRRPRNINPLRAAGLLYGDLGTSKAYVIGLAFAIAGYASFWLIAAVSILSILIGINYVIICKHHPHGGGVYSSVRHRSEVLSLLGAFFLFADFAVTASLSALSACYYLGLPDPALFAIIAILLIGVLNIWGPRHIGASASAIALIAIAILVVLALFSIPHLKQGWQNLQPLGSDYWVNWTHFVGVIVTLSGIETIANMTGIMQLDPHASKRKPSVRRTSKRAIFWVVFEVAFFTSLFSFVLGSINGLRFLGGEVYSPQSVDIRDYILRYLGTTFVGDVFGSELGRYFGYLVSLVFGILLLSAVNTAINGLISLQYLMSEDSELPSSFAKLNRFGVPKIPHIVATLMPVLILILVHDIASLAGLYAIGFVGAIAINLGSTSTNPLLSLLKKERVFMFVSFLIMTACEITLFIDKPHARLYVLIIITLGLILRGFTREMKRRKGIPLRKPKVQSIKLERPFAKNGREGILCAVNERGKALSFALKQAQESKCPIYFLFVREKQVLGEEDFEQRWEEDKQATKLFKFIQKEMKRDSAVEFYYAVSDSVSTTVLEYSHTLHPKHLIMDFPKVGRFSQLFHSDHIREILSSLSREIEYFIIPS